MATTGAEIARAYVTVYAKMPGIESDIDRALGGSGVRSTIDGHGKSMGAALAGAVGGAVAAVTSKAVGLVMGAIDGAVKRVDIMANFPKVMQNLGYSASDAKKSIDKMSESLKGLPTSLSDITSNVQRIAPSFSSLDAATKLALSLNNALLAGGSPLENQAMAFEQYSQAVGRGKFEMEEWRSLQTAMPGQLRQVAQSILGASGSTNDLYEAMKSGSVSMDDFNNAIVKLNSDGVGEFASFEKQARDATVGIGTGWANLETAITRNLANIIQRLKPMIDAFLTGSTEIANAIGPLVISIIDIVSSTIKWANANRDWLVPAGIIVGTIAGIVTAINVFKGAQLAWAAAMGGAQIATMLTGSSLTIYNGILKAQTIATNVAAGAKKAFDLVMSAGPIGLVVTAITALIAGLVYFFTQTETGKKAWGEFTRFLGEAWANISAFFVTVWEKYLKPVFEGIGQVLKFVWESILKPVFDGIATVAKWVFENILLPLFQVVQFGFAIMAGILQGVWDFIIKPIFDGFGALFTWIYQTIIVPVINGIVIYVRIWAAIFTWLWENAVKPAFDAIGAIFEWIWNNIISPVIGWIVEKVKLFGLGVQILWSTYVKPAFDAIGAIFQWIWNTIISPVVTWIKEKLDLLGLGFRVMYEQYIKPAWDSVARTVETGWNTIKGIIDTLVRVIQSDPKKAFEAARDAIGTAWSAIQDLAKKPVKFVIETVINGLIGTINQIPGVNIPKVPLPAGFSAGGYTGALPTNAIAGVVHGDEHVIRAASRRMIERSNPGLLDHMNRYGTVPGYARGGLVHPLPGAAVTTEFGGYPGHRGIDLAKPAGTPILAAASGAVSYSGWYGGGGNSAFIQHGGGLETRYKHMISTPIVGVGQFVKQKQVIGYEGSTGNSTGPHLHYEVIKNGVWQNPRAFLDGAGDAGLFDIIAGLSSSVMKQFTDKFPGSDMFVAAAGGLLKQGVDSVIGWATEKLSIGGDLMPSLYDNGGWLDPGTHLVQNRSGRPEPILTATQWDALLENRGGGLEPGDRLALVLDDGTELGAYVDRRAVGVVAGATRSASAGALTSRHGARRS